MEDWKLFCGLLFCLHIDDMHTHTKLAYNNELMMDATQQALKSAPRNVSLELWSFT